MYIKEITSQHSLDFSAVMGCEHCAAEEKLTSGYDDCHYHNRVIPAMHCKACGKNRAGEYRTDEVVAAAQANGVNGI